MNHSNFEHARWQAHVFNRSRRDGATAYVVKMAGWSDEPDCFTVVRTYGNPLASARVIAAWAVDGAGTALIVEGTSSL